MQRQLCVATTGWLLLTLLFAEALAARSAKYLQAAEWDSTRLLVGGATLATIIACQLLIPPTAYTHITAASKTPS
jgi:hypothetical protein